MKRLISTLLAIFTVAALICVPVMAEETTNEVLVADTSWYSEDDEDGIFFIEDAADFLGLAQIFDETGDNFANKTIELTADIDLNPGWDATVTVDATTKAVTLPATPANVFAGIKKFAGTLDGKGHSVKGLYMYGQGVDRYGFIIEGLGNLTIKNLVLDNGLIYAYVPDGGSNNMGFGSVIGNYKDGQGTWLVENVYSAVNVVVNRQDDSKGRGCGMLAGIVGRNEQTKQPKVNPTEYKVIEYSGLIKGTVYAGQLISMDRDLKAVQQMLNVSQMIGGGKGEGWTSTSGASDENRPEGVTWMWNAVINSVGMGDATYALNRAGDRHENYGEGKIDFFNYIEGKKANGTTIDESAVKISTYKNPEPYAYFDATLAANAFKWSAEAGAIVPVGVADMLDPNVAAMPNDPSYVPGGSNNEEEEEEEDDDDNGTTVTPPPAETTPVTEAPTTAAPAEEESGCASVASIAVVGVLALAAAPMLLKKKED